MHLGNAILAHEEWTITFRNAIANRETLDVVTISADNCCDLGQWLYGEGKRLFGQLPIHTDCVSTHELFHREAGRIAEAINANNLAGADDMLATHAPFSEASKALAVAILRLKEDALGSTGFISLLAKLSE